MKVKEKRITVADLVAGYEDQGDDGVVGYGGKLDIRPPYQREFVYNPPERNKVVDTVLRGFPLNCMYWRAREDGGYEVLDGQQRTISLCEYYRGRFAIDDLFIKGDMKHFHSLSDERKKDFLSYELLVYLCEGDEDELMDWFKTINIAGIALTKQEIRNAIYHSSWVSDAKRYFSKSGGPADQIAGKYLRGSAIRQDYLETAILWHSAGGDISEYMSTRRKGWDNARELWAYFESVIDWVKKIFPEYRKEMKGLPWGELHRKYKNDKFDAAALETRISVLMEDDDVENKKGIYQFVLTGDKKHLSLRTFRDSQKRAAFERQGGICGKGGNDGCGKKFELKEMHADHIIPWSRGGKTEMDNLQMLCADCNLRKSDN